MKLVKGRTLQAIITAIKKGDPLTTQHYTLDRLLTITGRSATPSRSRTTSASSTGT